MTRLIHISDLHFGRDAPELLDPLLRAVNRAKPDLVAVTGDFTQRARRSQYREARAFLRKLSAPWMAVPETTTSRSTISGCASSAPTAATAGSSPKT